ncbi:hypothetical protein [Actinomadura decatromicini]|uniref:Uncharacterized protein n=1 Tax=Actinomadura decatromicini TaxID=2604572 RepID=A0A5D3FGF3_9ACTN|nr:hypothetical protein [Actinomadura decatromicini]TYK47169.1 hypothetical protein FXF68_25560 [Actinomadura decatromicini]
MPEQPDAAARFAAAMSDAVDEYETAAARERARFEQARGQASANTYNGPATLVSRLDEIPVTADLAIEAEPTQDGALRSWRGTLASDDRRLVAVITRACELRFPDGKTGRVQIPGGSYDTDRPPSGPVLAEIVGEGPAPWLDTRPVDNP